MGIQSDERTDLDANDSSNMGTNQATIHKANYCPNRVSDVPTHRKTIKQSYE